MRMKNLIIILFLTGCVSTETEQSCPPKSDTEIIAETISDILVPKVRWGC